VELNYRQIAVAFGVAVFLAAFRYVFSTVPKAIALAGMVGGIAIVAVALLWTPPSPLAKESLPGFSSTFGLKIKDAAKLNRQYLFEYQDPEGAKVAFYFSAAGDRFVFSVTDTRGDVQSVDLPVGPGGVPIARFVAVTCQVGLATNQTFMRVLLDEREVQARSLPFRMDLGSRSWTRGTWGADNAGQNNAAFEALAFAAMGHTTLTDKNVKDLIGRLREYLRNINSPLTSEW
jgi:hypothetical protein